MRTQSSSLFSQIYSTNAWIYGSGEGSLPENTDTYRTWLQNFLAQENIHSVVDVGAGDWQFSRLLDWTGIRYVGVDVVPSVVQENRQKYGSHNISFVLADAAEEELPPADLLIVKDILQHWPDSMIHSFLSHLDSYKAVLITNDTRTSPHVDIPLGSYRPLDLTQSPFSFPLTEVFRYSGKERLTGKPWEKSVCLYRPAV